MMLRTALAALAVSMSIALASCQTTKIDEAIQKTLPQACTALTTAHQIFLSLALNNIVKPKTIAKEAAAYEGVKVLCADPANTTAVDALVRVASAYAVVSAALKEARNGQ